MPYRPARRNEPTGRDAAAWTSDTKIMNKNNRKQLQNHKSHQQMELFAEPDPVEPRPDAAEFDLQTFCRGTLRMSATAASFDLAVAVLTEGENESTF